MPASGAFSCAVFEQSFVRQEDQRAKAKTKQIPEKKAMIAHLKSMGRCGELVIERLATCDTFTTNPLGSGTV
jgi:hypothetical protein